MVFGYNIAGYYITFSALRYLNKTEIENSILNTHQKNIEVIEVKKNSFSYVNEEEINYHGKLYDIIRKEVKGDSVYFYCVNDKKEEHLFANLYKHIKNHLGDSGSLPDKSGKKSKTEMVKDYFPHDYSVNIHLSSNAFLYVRPVLAYQLFFKEITPPPPQKA